MTSLDTSAAFNGRYFLLELLSIDPQREEAVPQEGEPVSVDISPVANVRSIPCWCVFYKSIKKAFWKQWQDLVYSPFWNLFYKMAAMERVESRAFIMATQCSSNSQTLIIGFKWHVYNYQQVQISYVYFLERWLRCISHDSQSRKTGRTSQARLNIAVGY